MFPSEIDKIQDSIKELRRMYPDKVKTLYHHCIRLLPLSEGKMLVINTPTPELPNWYKNLCKLK